jgi:hypothetical protein
MKMKTKKTPAAQSTLKAVPTPASKSAKSPAPKSPKAVPASVVARLTRWNDKYPQAKCAWIVIDDATPATQKSCRICKKEFRNGRITRIDSHGAYCGPKCHRTTFAKK